MDIDEIVKHNEEHQTYGSMINVHELIDRDGKDKALINNWEQSNHIYLGGCCNTLKQWKKYRKLFEEFIKEMHPKFKYRTSIRTDCYWVEDEENGGYCMYLYYRILIIEADTMQGICV